MHPKLTSVEHPDDLERLLQHSDHAPVLLFKHSDTCGISLEALDELVDHLNEDVDAVQYGLVTVQTHRALSNAIATRLGVRHETPQAILVCERRAVWTASHFRVNASELRKALQHAGRDPQDRRATTDATNRPS